MTRAARRNERTVVLTIIVVGFLLFLLLSASVVAFAAWKVYQDVFVVAENPATSPDHLHPEQEPVTEVSGDLDPAVSAPMPSVPPPIEPRSDPSAEFASLNDLGGSVPGDDETAVRFITDLPSLGPEVPKTLGPTKSPIKYAWNSVDALVYDFEIEAELGSRKIKYRGRNTIQKTDKRPNAVDVDDQTGEGTGSGFVIHPQGIVVTCAHVVKGATRIQAVIEESEYSATVIKLDFENDLAVLRVEQNKLPFLTFADSDQVHLGQDVRAIGYPLSDVLGESIKVTKGEVSGRGRPGGVDGFQIDATVNPGNSGGPLVDDAGRLVGVTSSLLAGAGISEVGFAIPANKVTQIAEQLGVPIVIEDQATAISAADVIDRVSPATVLLKVTVGPGGVGMQQPHTMEYSGYVYQDRLPTAGNFSTGLPRDERFSGTFQVDTSGELYSDDTDGMMPMMLGGASQIGIEVLPDSSPGRTVSRNQIMIPQQRPAPSGPDLDPYGFGSFASRRRAPWIRQQTPPAKTSKWLLGTESTTVTLGKTLPDGIELEKSYSLRVEGESKDPQPMTIVGLGKGKFDPRAGRMLNMNYKVTITVNQDNITAKIPITMNYRLVDERALENERQARKEREQNRMREKARALENSGFASPQQTSTAVDNDIEFESVKSVPESTNLNKFDPDK
ncbi:protease DO [Rhodopirellula maiorica SM1]|uniref:Protease DO n=1 Tax=Rhodopirellula maiorica SM1 TaxID=1265738 RepID=M5RCM3_9BACT|nr:trypsin-like peptidase domain-containing protein [Rhodopirellula maiorica]EMI16796.1 protease DO [Rhodopirellula maiorica SM1]